MPVFEYQCTDCQKAYDIFFKTREDASAVECPSCHSKNHRKKLSSFAPSMGQSSSSYDGGCSTGTCGMPSFGGCANGLCGLN